MPKKSIAEVIESLHNLQHLQPDMMIEFGNDRQRMPELSRHDVALLSIGEAPEALQTWAKQEAQRMEITKSEFNRAVDQQLDKMEEHSYGHGV